jgi:hypothetical protein
LALKKDKGHLIEHDKGNIARKKITRNPVWDTKQHHSVLTSITNTVQTDHHQKNTSPVWNELSPETEMAKTTSAYMA